MGASDAYDHFNLFEIDLVWTRDRKLVCLHDWGVTAEWIFGRRFDQPATLSEFEQLVTEHPQAESCTLNTLVDWLIRNSGKRLVTDIKHDNIAGLTDLAAKLGQKVGQKVIPQIYSPDEYEQVRALGYRDIIWTLYRTSLDNREILAEVDNMTLYAVTMTREHAETGLARNLAQRGVRTYVHTVNTEREQRYFRELGVDEIYTDWLPAF